MVKKKPMKPRKSSKKDIMQFPNSMTARGWIILDEVGRVTGLDDYVNMDNAVRLYVEKYGERDGLDLKILESQDHIAKGMRWGHMVGQEIKNRTRRKITATNEMAIELYAREVVAKKYPNFDHSVLEVG